MPEKCRKKTDMPEQSQTAINMKSLAQVFKCWDFTTRLGAHPFSRLGVVDTYRASSGYADSKAGCGRALRELLMQVVDALAPSGEDPEAHDKRWRSHIILRERYMNGLGPDYVAEILGIARSTYNHEQKRALEEAADMLRAWEAEGLPAGTLPEVEGDLAAHAPPFTPPPRPPQGLVGRENLMARVRERLSPESGDRWLALHGLPGVGKTSLAIELAHDPDLRQRYPDGVLWAGLGVEPDPSHWLMLWGTALGIRPETLAALADTRQQAQAVHAAIGERCILLVVDDVWKTEDGLIFRMGGPNTAVLFTTRFPAVAHELAPEGTIPVEELDEEQGIQLLGRYVPSLAHRRESTAQELVNLASGLPMALVLIGGYLRREAYSGQSRRLAGAIEQLRAIDQVLEVPGSHSAKEGRADLAPGEALTLRKVIELSEAVLSPAGVTSLHELALHPPKPASFPEAAALAILEHGASAMDELVDMGLLEVVGDERYSMHSAINAFGRLEVVGSQAQARYIAFWLEFLERGETNVPRVLPEMNNIMRALELASEIGDGSDFVRGVNDFYPYLERSGQVERGASLLDAAREHAEKLADQMEMLRILAHLGRAYQRLGNYDKASASYQAALDLKVTKKAHDLRCACLQGLGVVAFSQGDFTAAADYYAEGLSQARQHDLVDRQAALLSNQATLFVSQADPEQAMTRFRESLRLARILTDRSLEAVLLSNLGALAAQEGDLVAAETYFEESYELARAGGERLSMAILLHNLGTLANDRGDPERAKVYFEQALGEARQMGDRAQASRILANLGALHTAQGEYELAETRLKEGLVLAEAIQHVENRILLYINLAELARFSENLDEAKDYLDQAEALAAKARHQRYENVIAEMRAGLGTG
jgi:tetratricopeptide (TPR) repeat protein